jgi:hypothetical protein
MYNFRWGGLAFTGVGTFAVLGHHFGIIQLVITALAMCVTGIVLYRLGTRHNRYVQNRQGQGEVGTTTPNTAT